MPAHNTPQSFGAVARTLHWLTALLILTAIPLGLIASDLPYDTAEALATKAQLFSIHKTIGVAAFLVALVRILWALTQPRPVSLHPERRVENLLADLVHWMLYISLVAMPLSGWIYHSAVTGFAPILWPFGQSLPFVPQSEAVAEVASAAHWLFSRLLIVSILLHVAGALKHHVIDRDATLRRMTRGTQAPKVVKHAPHSKAPLLAAVAIYAAGAVFAAQNLPEAEPAPAQATAAAATGNWQVTTGTLGFSIQQMGAKVDGSFANWTADIVFDETAIDGRHGTVTVSIDTTSLTLGSVTDQAKAADFFDVATYPTATFTADILPDPAGYVARGTLALRGASKEVSLPFTLTIDGDTATMQGSTSLDRRDYGMGAAYSDETTIGFTAAVTVNLKATRR
ncbi:MAG: cytochrome b/b6 domain-containing protein [Pseudomonadota bacterium]